LGKIVAIGGGEINENETHHIDKEIVKLTNKENPLALFIPTASGEPEGYIDTFKKVYSELGCKTDTLFLIDGDLSNDQIKAKILAADLIYVGGGDTERMLEIWKGKKVDEYLREAYHHGTVLSGLSAGSICWFEFGHSDSYTYRTGRQQDFFKIEGLGIVPGIHCPHYTEEGRENDFERMVEANDLIGIAIDDNCAIEFNGGNYRILKSSHTAKAFKIYKNENQIIKIELSNTENYLPLNSLYSKSCPE
jgi:dipeptidase E